MSTDTRDGDDLFPKSNDEFDPVESYRMPLMEHLRELRRRLIVVLVAGGIAFGVCFNWVNDIWAFLVAPMEVVLAASGREATMAMTEPLEGFLTLLKVAGVAALGMSSPVIFYQIWKFVAPGLYDKEKRVVMPLVFSSTVLFLGGAAFCYYVIFGYAFPFFIGITGNEIAALLKISSYLNFVTRLLIAFGVCFQLPVIIFFLARIGLIDHRDMIRFFRYAVVGIFLVASILTPPDVISQILMAGPLIVLYGVGIIVARVFSTKNRDALEDAAAE